MGGKTKGRRRDSKAADKENKGRRKGEGERNGESKRKERKRGGGGREKRAKSLYSLGKKEGKVNSWSSNIYLTYLIYC